MPETEDLTEVEQSAIFNAFARTTGTNNVSPLLAAVHDIVAAREAGARREALLAFADTRGVNVGDEDSEWLRGYRQAQRECLHAAIVAANAEPERDEEGGR